MARTIIAEPVGSACNLRCKYCYQEPVRINKQIMPDEVLEKMIASVEPLALKGEVKFIWHGGEPMLAGIEFFQKAWDLQQNVQTNGVKIHNNIQTNAVLIDQEWAEFLAEHDFRIGTSLDGPQQLHDSYRCNSYESVIRGIKHVQATGKCVGIVITVSNHNVDYPKLIWEKIIKPKDLATSFEINICYATELTYLTPPVDKCVHFLNTLFDLWMTEDDPEIYIKCFRAILRGMTGGNPADCVFAPDQCRLFVAVDERGDVYTCNRFIKRDIAYLGNILEQDLEKIMESEHTNDVYEQTTGLAEECLQCEWFMVCGGACGFQRWLEMGLDAGFPECEIRKQFFAYVKDYICE